MAVLLMVCLGFQATNAFADSTSDAFFAKQAAEGWGFLYDWLKPYYDDRHAPYRYEKFDFRLPFSLDDSNDSNAALFRKYDEMWSQAARLLVEDFPGPLHLEAKGVGLSWKKDGTNLTEGPTLSPLTAKWDLNPPAKNPGVNDNHISYFDQELGTFQNLLVRDFPGLGYQFISYAPVVAMNDSNKRVELRLLTASGENASSLVLMREDYSDRRSQETEIAYRKRIWVSTTSVGFSLEGKCVKEMILPSKVAN